MDTEQSRHSVEYSANIASLTEQLATLLHALKSTSAPQGIESQAAPALLATDCPESSHSVSSPDFNANLLRLLSRTNMILFEMEPDGTVSYVSNSLMTVLKLCPQDMVGRYWWSALRCTEDEAARFLAAVQVADVADFELGVLDNTGQSHVLAITALNRYASDGRLTRIMALATDITEHKRRDAQLRQFSQALEQSANTVVITNRQGTIEYVNPRFTETTGYERTEAIGHNPRILKSDATSAEGYQNLWTTISGGRSWRGEFHNRKKNGELYWESATISPIIDPSGQITHFVAVKEDITEQKRIESELRQSEERYRILIGALSEGVLLQNSDSEILTANASAEQILGREQSQLVGHKAVDLYTQAIHEDGKPFPPEDLPCQLALRTGLPQRNVLVGVHNPNGALLWLAINANPIVTAGEALPTAVVVSFTDVTERKSTEEALRRERNLLRTLIDNVPDIIYVKDTQSRFVTINSAVVFSFGQSSPETIIGKTDFDFHSPLSAAQFYAEEQEILRSGQPKLNFEQTSKHFGLGRENSVLTSKLPLRGSNGQIIGLIGVSRDITERKRAAESLQQREARFRAIFAEAAIGIALVDGTGRIVESNRALHNMLGYDSAALSQMTFRDITHPEDIAPDESLFNEIFAGQRSSYQLEKRYLHRDGRIIWRAMTVSVVRTEGGQPQYVIGMVKISLDAKPPSTRCGHKKNSTALSWKAR